jgi:hypothetical protein
MMQRSAKHKYRMASISIASRYGAFGAARTRIAIGYRLDSQSIFSQSGRPLFTARWESALETPAWSTPSRFSGTTMQIDSEIHSMSDFWRIVREGSKFGTAHACGETLP